MAEGAPLLREYVGKTCIESSNLSDSARCCVIAGPCGPLLLSGLKTSNPVDDPFAFAFACHPVVAHAQCCDHSSLGLPGLP